MLLHSKKYQVSVHDVTFQGQAVEDKREIIEFQMSHNSCFAQFLIGGGDRLLKVHRIQSNNEIAELNTGSILWVLCTLTTII